MEVGNLSGKKEMDGIGREVGEGGCWSAIKVKSWDESEDFSRESGFVKEHDMT